MSRSIRKSLLTTLLNQDKRFMSSVKKRKPIDPEAAKKVPIFDYGVSKKNYQRVFTWGNMHTGALGHPFRHNQEKVLLKTERHLEYPKRLGFGERIDVTTAASGFGFTVFGIDCDTNEKLFGTGINSDSQIGYHEVRDGHPLEVIFYPRPITIHFKNPKKTKVLKIAAGRAHTLVLTDEGLFTLGNNAFGQCGRKIIPDENYIMSNYIHHIENLDDKKIVDVECGQDHSLAITENGAVYSCGWGADGQTGLGHYDNCNKFTKVGGDLENQIIVQVSSRSDFVLALNDKGEVFGWGNNEYNQVPSQEENQQISTPRFLKIISRLGKIKKVATGGSFCLVLNDQNQVFSWGYGLLGLGPKAHESKVPLHIPEVLFGRNDFQPNNRVIDITCGLFYSTAITNLGELYVWGRNKHGCLGIGGEKDQYFPLKVPIGGFVSQVSCGVDHTVAICKPFV